MNDPWFGPSMVWGSPADLERVLGPTIREKLKTFPRKLAVISFHDRAMVIEWFGMEDDPAIVQGAFDLGIACLDSLAAR